MEKPYTVRIDARVRKLPLKHARQISAAINRLSINPHPQDSIKLKGSGGYRVTVGEYWILYTVDDDERLVTVFVIGPRKESKVYKQ